LRDLGAFPHRNVACRDWHDPGRFSIGIDQLIIDDGTLGMIAIIYDGRVRGYDRIIPLELARDECAPMIDVHRLGDGQPDIAINPRAGIKPRTGLGDIAANGQRVGAITVDELGEIKPEAGVPVRVIAQVLAIEPNIAIHVNAIELEEEVIIGREAGEEVAQFESFSIPPDAAIQIAAAVSGWAFAIERLLDHPVVRHIKLAPIPVREIRSFRAGRIAEMEPPVGVERNCLPGQFGTGGFLNQDHQDQRHETQPCDATKRLVHRQCDTGSAYDMQKSK
jgi:hypothetical protein